MKILVCASYKHAWNSIRPEAEIFIGLAQLGHEITIMTEGDAEYIPRLVENGIKVIDCYPKQKISLSVINSIRAELKVGKYDICYAFNSKTIPNAAFACIGLPVKFVAYRGTTGGIYRHDPSAYLTMLHPRVDGIICVSEAVRKSLLPILKNKTDNIVTIYKGQAIDWYQVEAADRAEFNLSHDDVVLFCAAHVRPSKGIDVLLDAVESIDIPSIQLLLAGHGFEPYLERIESPKLKSKVQLIGHRKDIPNLMKMADIQIQPSISGEGLPRTIIEAMANGTPSIVTTTGGCPELVDDGGSGYVVPTNDPIALAGAIRKLASNPQLCSEIGGKAKKKLQLDFNPRLTVEKHIQFFTRLLEK